MPFTLRPYRRSPVQCSVTYNTGLLFQLLLPIDRVWGQLTASGLQRANIVELSRPVLYCLTPVLIAPRVMLSGMKLR
jgi:hypothetical protein